MLEDPRELASSRAISVVRAYERSRGAAMTDVSDGHDLRLRMALEDLGIILPRVASADLISVLGDDTRCIEVKGRGSSGPLSIIERQRDTFIAAGPVAWLYVVWNTTQPGPYRLILVRTRSAWLGCRRVRRSESPGWRGARGTRRSSSVKARTSSGWG